MNAINMISSKATKSQAVALKVTHCYRVKDEGPTVLLCVTPLSEDEVKAVAAGAEFHKQKVRFLGSLDDDHQIFQPRYRIKL